MTTQPSACDPLTERFQSEFIKELKQMAARKQKPAKEETYASAIRFERLRNLWRPSKFPQSVA